MSRNSADRNEDTSSDSVVSRRILLSMIAALVASISSTFLLQDGSDDSSPEGTGESIQANGGSTATFGYGGTPIVDAAVGETVISTAVSTGIPGATAGQTETGSESLTVTPTSTSSPTPTPNQTTSTATPTPTPTESSGSGGTGGGGGGGSGGGSGTSTPTDSETPTPTPSSSGEILFGSQGFGEYGYGGVVG